VVDRIIPKAVWTILIRAVYPNQEVRASLNSPTYALLFGESLNDEDSKDLTAFDDAGGKLEFLVAMAGAYKDELQALGASLAAFEGESVSMVAIKDAINAGADVLGPPT
jgi:hypothetical protein